MSDTNFGLVAKAQSTFTLLKNQRKEEAEMLFILGKTINESNAGITIAAIADQSGVSKNRLKMCCKLAESLNNDEDKFDEEFDKIELATIDKLYSKFVTAKNRKKVTAADRLKDVLQHMERELEDTDTRYYALEALKGIKRRIAVHVPPDMTLGDKEYLKYYECTACGAYPPPDDGFQITHVDDVPVPVCEKCFLNGEVISMKRVAKMYHNYSIQMSRIILSGAMNISEEELDENAVYI